MIITASGTTSIDLLCDAGEDEREFVAITANDVTYREREQVNRQNQSPARCLAPATTKLCD